VLVTREEHDQAVFLGKLCQIIGHEASQRIRGCGLVAERAERFEAQAKERVKGSPCIVHCIAQPRPRAVVIYANHRDQIATCSAANRRPSSPIAMPRCSLTSWIDNNPPSFDCGDVEHVEWLQYRFTELATWSATGYTQVDNLPLLCRAGRGLGRAGVVSRDADRAPGRLNTDRTGEPRALSCAAGTS
jgi:hypothetical protein